MARKSNSVRKIDVQRMIEACKAGGVAIGRVEITDGKITIVSSSEAASTDSPLDQWLRTSNAR